MIDFEGPSSPADKSNLTAVQAALLSAHWAQHGSKMRTCECIDAPAPACPLKPTAEELDACYPVLLRNGHFYRVFPERHMLPGVVQLVASTSYCGITGLHFLSSFFCWRVGGGWGDERVSWWAGELVGGWVSWLVG